MPQKRQLRAATPREIRRAFGDNALEAINSHADAIEDVQKLGRGHDELIQHALARIELLEKEVHALGAWRQRNLLGRLTWLVTGR